MNYALELYQNSSRYIYICVNIAYCCKKGGDISYNTWHYNSGRGWWWYILGWSIYCSVQMWGGILYITLKFWGLGVVQSIWQRSYNFTFWLIGSILPFAIQRRLYLIRPGHWKGLISVQYLRRRYVNIRPTWWVFPVESAWVRQLCRERFSHFIQLTRRYNFTWPKM